MRRAVNRLSGETFDLLVIGGGATGACVARDAALRGLKVALIDRNDFAAATSAHNSKLVHGGLRYLRNFEIGLVREALQERRIWLDIAPHLVHPLAFLLPMVDAGIATGAVMGAGLTLYDLLAFSRRERLPAHRWLGREAVLAREAVLDQPGLRGAFEYHDAQMYSPERLALECVLDADTHGAAIANYVEASSLILSGGRTVGCTVREVTTGARFDVRAKAVLVAAGPWADLFLGHVLGRPPTHPLLRSKGIHLLVPQVTRSALMVAAGSGHFFVLPWRGHTLLGTTDTAFRGDPDKLGVSAAEIAEFLALIDHYLPAARLDPSMVEFFYAGLRPLVDDGSGDTYRASRRAELIDHGAEDGIDGLFSALGGKWTTSRALAKTVTDRIVAKLGRAAARCTTATAPLPGGRMAAGFKSDIRKLYPAASDHLFHMYGARLGEVLGPATPDLLQPLGHNGDIGAQILFAAREEMALTLGDAVMRRTGIGQFGRPAPATLDAAARIMGTELGWSEERRAREIAALDPWFRTCDAAGSAPA